MRAFLLACTLFCTTPALVQAQDQTLADIRQELTVLAVELQKLKRELSTTGGVATSVGGDTLQRIDLIEGELQRLTARTEELEFRLNGVVKDGTNRVDDLAFRICELEPDCDIANMPETTPLGGAEVTGVANGPRTTATTTVSTGVELAVGEEADFARALQALDGGDYVSAATLLEAFVDNYPGGPLISEAHYYRGEALTGQGVTKEAARAFLEAYSTDPNGRLAADALLGLGSSLGQLGQVNEACVTLGEVAARFPGNPRVPDAEAERDLLGCS